MKMEKFEITPNHLQTWRQNSDNMDADSDYDGDHEIATNLVINELIGNGLLDIDSDFENSELNPMAFINGTIKHLILLRFSKEYLKLHYKENDIDISELSDEEINDDIHFHFSFNLLMLIKHLYPNRFTEYLFGEWEADHYLCNENEIIVPKNIARILMQLEEMSEMKRELNQLFELLQEPKITTSTIMYGYPEDENSYSLN